MGAQTSHATTATKRMVRMVPRPGRYASWRAKTSGLRVEEPREVEEHRRCKTHGIQAIEHSAMTLDHHPPILGAEAAFHGGQRKAAEEPHRDDHERHRERL